MPDHVHLIPFPTPAGLRHFPDPASDQGTRRSPGHRVPRPECPGVASSFDAGTRETRRTTFLAAGGGYDRNVTEPRTLHAMIDYVHLNPVRRGWSSRPGDCAGPVQLGSMGMKPAVSSPIAFLRIEPLLDRRLTPPCRTGTLLLSPRPPGLDFPEPREPWVAGEAAVCPGSPSLRHRQTPLRPGHSDLTFLTLNSRIRGS